MMQCRERQKSADGDITAYSITFVGKHDPAQRQLEELPMSEFAERALRNIRLVQIIPA